MSFIEETFKTFDEDNSGTLDRVELDKAFSSFETPEFVEKFEELGLTMETMKATTSSLSQT